MELRWVRQPEEERGVLAMYESQGVPADAAPLIFYGYDLTGAHRLKALLAYEPWGDESRWHLSISAQDRVPSWDEIAMTAHMLRPGVPFVMGIPPRSWWLNTHPNVLHLWQTGDELLVDEWRRNRSGDDPS